MRDTVAAYGGVTRFLHWLLLLLIAVQFGFAIAFFFLPEKSSALGTAIMLHESTGLLILAFGVAFILWRWANPKPSLAELPAWQRVLARLVHIVIYVAIIAQPVIGIGMTMTHGHAVPFYGLFEIPQFLAKSKAAGAVFGYLHWLNGWWIILIALGIHTLASLYHHFVARDRVLSRMWTGH